MKTTKKSKPVATVNVFLIVLGGELLRYDERQAIKPTGGYYNPHAMNHYTRQLNKVTEDTMPFHDSASPKAMHALRVSLCKHWVQRGAIWDTTFDTPFSLPPINKVVKKIKGWVERGTYPSYPVSKKIKDECRKEKLAEGKKKRAFRAHVGGDL